MVVHHVLRQHIASHAVVVRQGLDDLDLGRSPCKNRIHIKLNYPANLTFRSMLAGAKQRVDDVGIGRHNGVRHPSGVVQALPVRPGLHTLLAATLGHIQ